ncbi:MAG: hypothetical protein ACAI44_02365 [Candidatus Sericytochromatia bacterium]
MEIGQTPQIKSTEPPARAAAPKAAEPVPPAEPAHPTVEIQDQGPELGKASGALTELNLLDDPQSLNELVEAAMGELSHGSRLVFGDAAPAPRPFAEREAEMQQNLKSKLNERVFVPDSLGKAFVYRFSNEELRAQIAKLKGDVKNIVQQREMGMTDCWGTMTNHQVACESAIKALELCLSERKRELEVKHPGPVICPPYVKQPPFLKI